MPAVLPPRCLPGLQPSFVNSRIGNGGGPRSAPVPGFLPQLPPQPGAPLRLPRGLGPSAPRTGLPLPGLHFHFRSRGWRGRRRRRRREGEPAGSQTLRYSALIPSAPICRASARRGLRGWRRARSRPPPGSRRAGPRAGAQGGGGPEGCDVGRGSRGAWAGIGREGSGVSGRPAPLRSFSTGSSLGARASVPAPRSAAASCRQAGASLCAPPRGWVPARRPVPHTPQQGQVEGRGTAKSGTLQTVARKMNVALVYCWGGGVVGSAS